MSRRTNKNTLRVYWSKRDGLTYWYPTRPQDGHLLHMVFSVERPHVDYSKTPREIAFDPSFVKELEARGYDVTTLRFSVCLKEPDNA